MYTYVVMMSSFFYGRDAVCIESYRHARCRAHSESKSTVKKDMGFNET